MITVIESLEKEDERRQGEEAGRVVSKEEAGRDD